MTLIWLSKCLFFMIIEFRMVICGRLYVFWYCTIVSVCNSSMNLAFEWTGPFVFRDWAAIVKFYTETDIKLLISHNRLAILLLASNKKIIVASVNIYCRMFHLRYKYKYLSRSKPQRKTVYKYNRFRYLFIWSSAQYINKYKTNFEKNHTVTLERNGIFSLKFFHSYAP